MASEPKKFIVTRSNGTRFRITAETMEHDGSGTRLFDEAGQKIANYPDGTIKSCEREDLIEELD